MAVTMFDSSNIQTPDVRSLVSPVLQTLPGAAVSTEPPAAILPMLSPILRQRVQLLSSAAHEPWIRLLTYNTDDVPKLSSIAQDGSLEPHPASGEIEVDWDYDTQVQYRRIDHETLQALVVLETLGLFVRLVYCTGDQEGGGDGWRVGEVGATGRDGSSPLEGFGGLPSLGAAEASFAAQIRPTSRPKNGVTSRNKARRTPEAQTGGYADEDDDDYWARYDATPARTPAAQASPAKPPTTRTTTGQRGDNDDYYSRYDQVQPAMDPHDPDEEAEQMHAAPPLGLARPAHWASGAAAGEAGEGNESTGAWAMAAPAPRSPSARSREEEERTEALVHPRPDSSASSNGSGTVARLELTAQDAERRGQAEMGVKQHVARSIRSLFLLSRASGIDREEFEHMVREELDVLAVLEQDI